MVKDTSYSLDEQKKPEQEIRLSIAVMHMPDDEDRRAMLVQMERAMGGIQQIREHVLDYQVVRDVAHKGIWPTARLAWARYHPKATHHLLLQDDMLPCKDFLPGLKKVIAACPHECITLFSMREKIVEQVLASGGHWYVCPNNVWGGAVVLPTSMIMDFLGWCRKHIPEDFKHDDSRLSLYLERHKRQIWTAQPSLVEHIGAAKSLVGQSNKRRVASAFLDKTSALSIDWMKGIDNPIRAPGSRPYAEDVYQEELTRGAGSASIAHTIK